MSGGHYFKKLASELDKNQYRERFLSELENHAEDYFEDKKIPPKSHTERLLERLFGRVIEVNVNFINIVDPWKKYLQRGGAWLFGVMIIIWINFSEALQLIFEKKAYGSFSSFLVLITFLFLPYFLMWYLLLHAKTMLNSKWELFKWVFVPNAIYLVYNFAWFIYGNSESYSRLSDAYHKSATFISMAFIFLSFWIFYKKRKRIFQLGVVFYLGFLLYLLFQLVSFSHQVNRGNEANDYFTLIIIALFTGIMGFLMYAKLKGRSKNKEISKLKGSLKIGLSVYVISYALLRLINPFLTFDFIFEDILWWKLLLFPIYIVESGLFFSMPAMGTGAILVTHYFQIGLALQMFSFRLIYMISKRKITAIPLTICIFVGTLIFVPTHGLVENKDLLKPEFSAPTIQISEKIERQQYGYFYKMIKYLERQHKNGPGYEIAQSENGFQFMQFSRSDVRGGAFLYPKIDRGLVYSYDQASGHLDRIKAKDRYSNFLDLSTLNEGRNVDALFQWPEELECVKSSRQAYGSYSSCETLMFKKQVLFSSQTSPLDIFDLALSKDGSLLALSVLNTSQNHNLYLIDLDSES